MSNAEHEPTNRPKPGDTFQPLGYLLSLQFHQPIKLVRPRGLDFAKALSTCFEPREMEWQDSEWAFVQKMGDNAAGCFRLLIHETDVTVEVGFTENRLGWFQTRCGLILDEFRKAFTPAAVLATTVRVNGTLQIDGDARTFLATHVTHFNTRRLQVLQRPVQLFGIRLSMPPYRCERPPKGKKKKPTVETVDWHIEAKAESLMADPTKLYLETTTLWQKPAQWDDKTTQTHLNRLQEVSDFLQTNLIPCLTTDLKNGGN